MKKGTSRMFQYMEKKANVKAIDNNSRYVILQRSLLVMTFYCIISDYLSRKMTYVCLEKFKPCYIPTRSVISFFKVLLCSTCRLF